MTSKNIIYHIGDLEEEEKQDEKKERNDSLDNSEKDGDDTEKKDLLVPIIGGACGFGLIVLIIVIFVYYCKVVRKPEETEVTHENTVYNAWDYYYAGDNYVKDVNIEYDTIIQ